MADGRSAFWENTQFNADLRKSKTQHLIRKLGGVRKADMTPDEVIQKLTKSKVDISRQTLRNYEHWGLIPVPARGGAGKGHGRTTDYPDDTVPQACASYKELHLDDGGHKIGVDLVAAARRVVLTGEWNGPELSLIYSGIAYWWITYSLCKNNLLYDDNHTESHVKFTIGKTDEIQPKQQIDFNPLIHPKANLSILSAREIKIEFYLAMDETRCYMLVYELDKALKKWIFRNQEEINLKY